MIIIRVPVIMHKFSNRSKLNAVLKTKQELGDNAFLGCRTFDIRTIGHFAILGGHGNVWQYN